MKRPVVFVILQTGARANGGLRSISEVMCRLKDHQPIILTNLETALTDDWRNHGIDVQVVPENASGGFGSDPVCAIRTYRHYHAALGSLLERSEARVVHANDPLAFQLSLSAAKWSRKTRIALNLRDTLDPDRRPPRLKYRMMFAAADHVFYLSNDMAERWQRVASNAMRSCSVTYSIVDSDRFALSPVPRRDIPVVLVSGIFRPKKGQLEFIRNAVPELSAHGIATWFAGDFEPDRNAYAAACAAAAEPFAQWVRFLGYQNDLAQSFNQASVVAIPSRHEGLVRGMIEAMSCGRPVVSFDVCSAREILEDKATGSGTVVPSGDYSAMAEALVRYANDLDAAEAAGREGSAAARTLFDADNVAQRYERVYYELGEN